MNGDVDDLNEIGIVRFEIGKLTEVRRTANRVRRVGRAVGGQLIQPDGAWDLGHRDSQGPYDSRPHRWTRRQRLHGQYIQFVCRTGYPQPLRLCHQGCPAPSTPTNRPSTPTTAHTNTPPTTQPRATYPPEPSPDKPIPPRGKHGNTTPQPPANTPPCTNRIFCTAGRLTTRVACFCSTRDRRPRGYVDQNRLLRVAYQREWLGFGRYHGWVFMQTGGVTGRYRVLVSEATRASKLLC